MLLKTLGVVVPEPLVLRDPVPHRTESFGDKAVAALTAVPALGYETGIEQDTKVLGDGGAAHFKVCSNVADRALGVGEQIKHLTPHAMADRGEHIGFAIGKNNHASSIRK